MSDFPDFVRSLGIRPRGPIAPDGRWHRCGTNTHPRSQNGAYRLMPDGRFGFAQDWASMDTPAKWEAGRECAAPEFDRTAFRRTMDEARQQERKATREAQEFYENCEPLRDGHPYLKSHGLDMQGCYGLRVDREGWMVIPALRARQIQSVQRISPAGDKRFWPGAPVAGSTYLIERRQATVNVLCEGLATGLACFAALPTCRVIVAWHAGNLSRVEVPPGLTVIAADNDHATELRRGLNPGIEAAEKAAKEIGCGVAYPTGITGTDWADYREECTHALNRTKQVHQTIGDMKRQVDGQIAAALMRGAKFVAGIQVS